MTWRVVPVALLLAACDGDLPVERTGEPARVAQPPIRQAVLFRAAQAEDATRRRFVARVEAARTVEAAFEVGGTLAELPIREGQTIPAGERIAALQQTDYVLAEREARVNVRLTQSDYERKRSLLARRGISESAVDDARAQADLARVRAAQAKERLRKTVLYAPFDAYIAQRRVDNHTKVQPTMPVARLLDLSVLHLVASVPETLLATLNASDIEKLEASFAAAPERRFPVQYLEHRGEADPVAQTFEVTFTLQPPDGMNLLPGMTATVDLRLRGDAPGTDLGLRVPPGALVTAADGSFAVWQVDEATNQVSRRAVRVDASGGGGIRVIAGLEDGALIVASGVNLLRDGMRVTSLEN
ncbi:MAG: efflux RND transporter periplasmic adaptor subunit [Pseudomonadota bacterium]